MCFGPVIVQYLVRSFFLFSDFPCPIRSASISFLLFQKAVRGRSAAAHGHPGSGLPPAGGGMDGAKKQRRRTPADRIQHPSLMADQRSDCASFEPKLCQPCHLSTSSPKISERPNDSFPLPKIIYCLLISLIIIFIIYHFDHRFFSLLNLINYANTPQHLILSSLFFLRLFS